MISVATDYLARGAEWISLAWDMTPWARAGIAVAIVAAALLAIPMSRLLNSNPVIVGCLIASIGAVLVFTLTPHVRTFGLPETCSFALTRPHRSDLTEPTDISMNMLLLFPVGLFAMWLRPLVAVLSFALIGLVLPFAVEYAQYAFASLGRTCSFYDVGTNLLGLCVGFALGLAIRLLWVIGSRIVQWAR